MINLLFILGSPDSLLEFVRVDPLFHPVEEGGPGVGPEGGDPFFRLPRPQAGQAGSFSPTFMIRSKQWPQDLHSYS